MKVLHVCESLIGGPASYFDEILPFQVRYLSPKNVVALVPEAHRGHLGPQVDCIVETYERTGRNLRSLLLLGNVIRATVRSHRPDIVHLHSSFAGLVGRLLMFWPRYGARVVYCAHCWSFDRPFPTSSTRAYGLIERALYGLTDAIVNVSPHENVLLRERGFPSVRTKLIVTGLSDLSVDRPNPPRASRKPGGPLRLLFAGRMDSQKGIDLLLEEFMHIAPERATLAVIGMNVVDSCKVDVPAAVQVIEWVPRASLPDMLTEFDAVIMPSRWEGMPLWALEVFRSGRPLVASNHGVFPHIIRDGIDGVLVDIRVPGFVDRALRVLESSDLSAMGRAARATYEARFRSERMNSELLELYAHLQGSWRDKSRAVGLLQRPGFAGSAKPQPAGPVATERASEQCEL